jgi:hypothetical protein
LLQGKPVAPPPSAPEMRSNEMNHDDPSMILATRREVLKISGGSALAGTLVGVGEPSKGAASDDEKPAGLVIRSLFDASGDIPHMPRRIDNPPDAITPELIRRRDQNPGTGEHRPLYHYVRVFDIKVDHH